MAKMLIIDGNSLLFRGFYATYAINPNNIMKTTDGFPTNAIFAFSNMIASLLSTLKKDDAIFVAFDSGKHTFRHQEYPEYKANRQKTPEELLKQMPVARDFLDKLGIIHYESEEIEADDIAGIMAKKAAAKGYDVEIYTSDKDYLQLIDDKITVELIKKGLKEVYAMTPESFKEEWGFDPIQITDYKGLRGDDSDNLKGIPGVGDKTAKSLIQKFGTLEEIIKNADTKSKVGQNIIEYQDNGRLCKHLAIIVTDRDLPYEPEDLIYKGYDFNEINNFAQVYQFKYLLNKLPKSFKKENITEEKVEFCEVFNSNDIDFENKIGIGIDYEENVNYHVAKLFGISLTNANKTYYITTENLLKDKKLLDLLASKDIKKYCFDYKTIYCVLHNAGIKINGLEFDLLLANYLCDSNSQSNFEFIITSLGYDISYAYKNESPLFSEGNKILSSVKAYFPIALAERIKQKLLSLNQLQLLYDIEQPLTVVLANMEIEGFPLDENILLEFKKEYQAKADQLTKEIYDLAGEEFNINSPKQVAQILYEKLGLPGNRKGSTSVEHLQTIRFHHPIVEKILEYRKYTKQISTYIDGFIPFIDNDGKVHCTFNQALTTTGRLSCSEPNLQNISTRDEESKQIRKAFYYKEENVSILSLDYSQIELRMLAHLSNSKSLINMFNNNEDIHSSTARLVFGLDREPTSLERRKAKAVNFGIVYGISDWGLSEQLEIPVNESREIIMNFYKAFPEIKAYLNKLVEEATTNGYATTMFNRRRYLPEINSDKYQLREFAKRAAMNAPIQGSASDLIKIAMIKVYDALIKGSYKSKIVSQIHDELILKVYDDEKEDVYKLVKDIMENCVKLHVSLKVDGGYAKNWYLAK